MHTRQFVYTVSAYSLSGPRKATCILAVGAMRLADEWAEQRCIMIRVADPFGVSFTREAFRATLPIV